MWVHLLGWLIICGNDIFAKIVQNCCKNNARFFSKYFPEFKENFYSEKFLNDVFAFASDYDMRLDLNEMISGIYRSVEYSFFREIAFSLIYRDCDKSKADNIINENMDEIEFGCWDCFSIDDVCDLAERYAN